MEGGHWPVGGWVGGGEGEGMRGREINEEALLPTHLPPPTAHRPPPQVVSGSAITQMRPTGGVATPRADALVDFGFFFPFSGLSSLVFISFSLKNQKRNWLFFGGGPRGNDLPSFTEFFILGWDFEFGPSLARVDRRIVWLYRVILPSFFVPFCSVAVLLAIVDC